MQNYESDFDSCSEYSDSIDDSQEFVAQSSSKITDELQEIADTFSEIASSLLEKKDSIAVDERGGERSSRPPSEASIESYNGGLNQKRNIAWLIENSKIERSNGSLNNSIDNAFCENKKRRKSSKKLLDKRPSHQKVTLTRSSQHSLHTCLSEHNGSETISVLQASCANDDDIEAEKTFDDLYQRQVYPAAFLGPARLDYSHPLEYEYLPPSNLQNSDDDTRSSVHSMKKEDFEIFQDVTAQEYLQICGLSSKRTQSARYASGGVKEKLMNQLASFRVDSKALHERIRELSSYTLSLESLNMDWLQRYEDAWSNRNRGALQLLVAERELTKLYENKHEKIRKKEDRPSDNRRKLEASSKVPNKTVVPKPPKNHSRNSSRLTLPAFDKLTNFIREPDTTNKKKRPTSPFKRDFSERAVPKNPVLYEEIYDIEQLKDCKGDLAKAKLAVDPSSFRNDIQPPIIKRQKRIDVSTKIEQNAIIVRKASKRPRPNGPSNDQNVKKRQRRKEHKGRRFGNDRQRYLNREQMHRPETQYEQHHFGNDIKNWQQQPEYKQSRNEKNVEFRNCRNEKLQGQHEYRRQQKVSRQQKCSEQHEECWEKIPRPPHEPRSGKPSRKVKINHNKDRSSRNNLPQLVNNSLFR